VVTGASFANAESGITIVWDGVVVAGGITAGASGDWTGAFTVPVSVTGGHRVSAYGSVTPISGVAEVTFKVNPNANIAPATGYVGAQVTISGDGFAANKPVSVAYDGIAVAPNPSSATTSPQGSFTVTFVAPRSRGGLHKVRVSDGISAKEFDWAMESTAPPIVQLLQPEAGQRLSLFGDVPVTWKWSEVTDPSGVTYVLEVSSTADFSNIVLRKADLSTATYTTTAVDTLPLGQYFWRVKAIDGAYNESAWTAPADFRTGLMPLWAFILSIMGALVVVVVLAIFVRRAASGSADQWWRT
jgi:hypothetical protein